MTYQRRLKSMFGGAALFVVVWLTLMVWDYRGVPPREELEGLARGVGFALVLLIIVETVVHLVRTGRRHDRPAG